MQRLFFAFPSGLPGAGLLLLRIAVAALGLHETHLFFNPMAMSPPVLAVLRILSVTAAMFVLIGLATPIGCLTLGLEAMSIFMLSYSHGFGFTPPGLLLLNLTVMTIVTAAVGPGAFSLDARLFGRREIVFPD